MYLHAYRSPTTLKLSDENVVQVCVSRDALICIRYTMICVVLSENGCMIHRCPNIYLLENSIKRFQKGTHMCVFVVAMLQLQGG